MLSFWHSLSQSLDQYSSSINSYSNIEIGVSWLLPSECEKERVMQWWVWMLGICSDSTLATSGVPGPPLIRWYSQTAGNLCAYLSYAVSSRLIGWLVTGGGAEPGARPITAGGNRPITGRGTAAWVLASMCTVILWYSKSGCLKMKILMRSSAPIVSIVHLS